MGAGDVHGFYTVGDNLLIELAVGNRGSSALAAARTLEEIEQRHQQQRDDDPESQIAEIIHGHLISEPVVGRFNAVARYSINR
jgi:hypothetical protein